VDFHKNIEKASRLGLLIKMMSEEEEEECVASLLSDCKEDPIQEQAKWLKKNKEEIEHLKSQLKYDNNNKELKRQLDCKILKQEESEKIHEKYKRRAARKEQSDLEQLYGINDNNTNTTMTTAAPVETQEQITRARADTRMRETIRRMEEEGFQDDVIIRVMKLDEHEKTWLLSQQK
jgi:hypothetical protein